MKIIQIKEDKKITKQEKQYLGILLGTFVISFFYLGNNFFVISPKYNIQEKNTESLVLANPVTDNKIERIFQDLDVRADSIIVLNTSNNEKVYSKNIDQVMPLASLVKIMTAVIAMENIKDDEIIKIPREALRQVGDNGLLVDEKWKKDDLIRFMLITSSNDAARAIAMHVGSNLGLVQESDSVNIFVDLMNEKAKSLDLSNMIFLNESGLDVDEKRNGGYGTTKEIATLFDYAIKKYPEIFYPTSFNSSTFISLSATVHNALNTNQNTNKVSGITASKTGFTNLSGGNLIISMEDESGNTVITGVLGSTFIARFSDIEKLANITLKIINDI